MDVQKEKKYKIAVAVSGASGAIYAKRFLEKIMKLDSQVDRIALVFSHNASEIWKHEIGSFSLSNFDQVTIYKNDDFFSPIASGSSAFDAMVIIPCSMGMIGRIASGISDDLMTRAADVMLKERRKLIVVPRENPLNLIHLRNLVTLTEAGGIVCMSSPSFYSNPGSIEELIDTVVDRIIDLIGLKSNSYRWPNNHVSE